MDSKSGETSSSKHRQAHAYGELGEAFPGSNLGHGGTVQQFRVQPEIPAPVEVLKPAVGRAPTTRSFRPRSARRAPQSGSQVFIVGPGVRGSQGILT